LQCIMCQCQRRIPEFLVISNCGLTGQVNPAASCKLRRPATYCRCFLCMDQVLLQSSHANCCLHVIDAVANP
jgi:hypothetical protein